MAGLGLRSPCCAVLVTGGHLSKEHRVPFQDPRGGDTGKILILITLLLLFVGGTLLLVLSVVDFMHSPSKQEKETGNRRKAA